ncbi:MAG: cobalt ECF transporter T component CbiQ [Deltaproteobacteria bacterium]|nr:cobalt ECF transporter T component CbiQ [Deltaproteobacteria bacterium]
MESSFVVGNSMIHRLDPRFRVAMVIGYSVFIAIADRLLTLLFTLGLSVVLVALSRLGAVRVFRRLVLVNGMILVFWLILPLTVIGETVLKLGPLTFSQAGVLLAARLTLKSNSILLALIALLATCPVTAIGYAMKSLWISEKIVYLFLITYRYLFVLEQEYQRLMTAAKIRCFRPGNNLHTYRTFAYLIGMLFVRASLRGERVYQAMRCRGFNGRFYLLYEFKASRIDWIFLAALSLAILLLGFMEWGIIQ